MKIATHNSNKLEQKSVGTLSMEGVLKETDVYLPILRSPRLTLLVTGQPQPVGMALNAGSWQVECVNFFTTEGDFKTHETMKHSIIM